MADAAADSLGEELELEDDEWLARQAEAAQDWLGRGHGTFALGLVGRGALEATSVQVHGVAAPASHALQDLFASLEQDTVRELATGPAATTLRHALHERATAMGALQDAGHRDALLVVAATSRGEAVVLGALNDAPIHLSKQAAARLQASTAPIAAIFGARRAASPSVPPGRRTETLRTAARDEIGRTEAARPTEVSALWDEMARGKLRVIDHHDHGGRRYLIAIEGHAGGQELDELQVEALSMLSDGYTQKDIADALAISPATVSRRLAAALETMGLRSTAEAVAIFGGALQSED